MTSSTLAGEIVLLDLRSESYFGLDEIGTRIWGLLETGINIGEVVQRLLQEYDVDQITLEADVTDLLERLLEAELVHYSNET